MLTIDSLISGKTLLEFFMRSKFLLLEWSLLNIGWGIKLSRKKSHPSFKRWDKSTLYLHIPLTSVENHRWMNYSTTALPPFRKKAAGGQSSSTFELRAKVKVNLQLACVRLFLEREKNHFHIYFYVAIFIFIFSYPFWCGWNKPPWSLSLFEPYLILRMASILSGIFLKWLKVAFYLSLCLSPTPWYKKNISKKLVYKKIRGKKRITSKKKIFFTLH